MRKQTEKHPVFLPYTALLMGKKVVLRIYGKSKGGVGQDTHLAIKRGF
jgi:hypothetical protein